MHISNNSGGKYSKNYITSYSSSYIIYSHSYIYFNWYSILLYSTLMQSVLLVLLNYLTY